jgi:hypothetical protein
MREVVNQKRTGRTRKRDGLVAHSALRIPNSAFATDSFPDFILGWTIGVIGISILLRDWKNYE